MSAVAAVVIVVALLGVLALTVAAASVRILREYERAVVFRLGRLVGEKGPGLVLLIPAVDRMVRVDLRTVTLDIPPQSVITRDNVPAKVNAVCYFRVIDAARAVVEVERYLLATTADRPDDDALGARQGRPRHAALRARAAQRGAAADRRRAHRPVGHQGHDRRDQGRRDPDGDAARDGAGRRGRARAAGEGHPRRGRVPGLQAPPGRRRHHLGQPGVAAAALPADADRDRRDEQLDGGLPAPARHREAVRGGAGLGGARRAARARRGHEARGQPAVRAHRGRRCRAAQRGGSAGDRGDKLRSRSAEDPYVHDGDDRRHDMGEPMCIDGCPSLGRRRPGKVDGDTATQMPSGDERHRDDAREPLAGRQHLLGEDHARDRPPSRSGS